MHRRRQWANRRGGRRWTTGNWNGCSTGPATKRDDNERADARNRYLRESRTADVIVAGAGVEKSPIGLAGRIVTATQGKAGLGDVELRIPGGTEVFIARSADPLPRGQRSL